MADILSRFTRTQQPTAERQSAAETEIDVTNNKNSILDELREIKRLLCDLVENTKKTNDLLLRGLDKNALSNTDTFHCANEERSNQHNELKVVSNLDVPPKTELYVSPKQNSIGILLYERESGDPRAQFILEETTGKLSFNPISFDFCIYDVEARLMPFAEVILNVQDKKANAIQETEAGKAEKRDGSWYCSVKPKLKIE